MCESDFHVISRFRNDVVLYYPTLEKKTGKRGHPKWFDGKIDFANLDLTRCKEYEVNKETYLLRAFAYTLNPYSFPLFTSYSLPILFSVFFFHLYAN